VSILSRFTKLQILHLRRKNVPSPSTSPSSYSSTSSSSLSSNPGLLAFLSAPDSPQDRSLLPFPSLSESESESIASSVHVNSARTSREHHYLKSWAKSCSSLESVVFLSGAEWCVVRRRKRSSTRALGERKLGSIQEEERAASVVSFVGWRLEE
jgi:hypothetical protein